MVSPGEAGEYILRQQVVPEFGEGGKEEGTIISVIRPNAGRRSTLGRGIDIDRKLLWSLTL